MRARRFCSLLFAALAASLASAAGAALITPELAREIARRSPDEPIAVIVQLTDRVNLLPYEIADRRRRDTRLLRALKAKSDQTLPRLTAQLDLAGATRRKPLWINNAIAVTLPVRAIDALARLAAVARIQYDAVLPLLAEPASSGAAVTGWNLAAMHVPDVWTLGDSGAGVVVANMDTGVDAGHPDLGARWRGGANSWFDPYGQHATPYDANGHGTQTMGLMVAGAAGGSAIGVAPGARWIAAKIFNDAGLATLSNIHLAFQWLLDPDGDPSTVDAPDVVNGSWGLAGPAGACDMEFNEDIQALNTAGTVVVFAAGNGGPAASTGASPASNPAGFSSGALDQALLLSDQSSRGPSSCDGTIFPKLVAPGVNVRSTDLSFGGLALYATVSGTSFAAPHAAGAIALLASAYPAASVTMLNNALTDSAADLGPAGADNGYGYGMADALAAFHWLGGAGVPGQHTPVITSLPGAAAFESQQYQYQMVAVDADGDSLVYRLAAGPEGMTIGASTGLLSWIPSQSQAGANPVTVTVTDPSLRAAAQAFSIVVGAPNHAPVSSNDSYGVTAGTSLAIAAPGVLANDHDADGDRLTAQLASNPAHGVLTLAADGSFSYVPAAGYAGADSFSYRASDGKTTGNVANVALAVSAPPLASNDSYGAPVYRSGSYVARLFAVLANDSASAGLQPASVTIVQAPNKRGSALVKPDGSIAYTPALRFSGVETFSYKVRDSLGAWSNSATVTVTVR